MYTLRVNIVTFHVRVIFQFETCFTNPMICQPPVCIDFIIPKIFQHIITSNTYKCHACQPSILQLWWVNRTIVNIQRGKQFFSGMFVYADHQRGFCSPLVHAFITSVCVWNDSVVCTLAPQVLHVAFPHLHPPTIAKLGQGVSFAIFLLKETTNFAKYYPFQFFT